MDASLITALAAVVGVIVTVWRQLAQQAADRRLRLDDKFTSIVAELGGQSTAIQASAAVSITNFLKPRYRDFHEQVLMVLLVNLKLDRTDVVNSVLIKGFEKAIRMRLRSAGGSGAQSRQGLSYRGYYRAASSLFVTAFRKAMRIPAKPARDRDAQSGVDLSHCNLYRADLSGLGLSNADLGFTRLQGANLTGADLSRAQGWRANLRGLDMIRA